MLQATTGAFKSYPKGGGLAMVDRFSGTGRPKGGVFDQV